MEAEANVRFPNVLRLTCGRDELERTLLFEQLKKLKVSFYPLHCTCVYIASLISKSCLSEPSVILTPPVS